MSSRCQQQSCRSATLRGHAQYGLVGPLPASWVLIGQAMTNSCDFWLSWLPLAPLTERGYGAPAYVVFFTFTSDKVTAHVTDVD